MASRPSLAAAALCSALAVVSAVPTAQYSLQPAGRAQFLAYMAEQGKLYTTEEEIARRQTIFAANMHTITAHNAGAAAGEHSFTMGVGPFTDLTYEEWVAAMQFTEFETPPDTGEEEVTYLPTMSDGGASSGVDWRSKGAVTPVKNQGKCGSCWSFSTTGSIEGSWKIKGHKLESLSEQQLMDCSGHYGNKGCQGGSMASAMKYVIENKGLDTEKDYPYKGKNEKCDPEKAAKHAARIEGVVQVPRNDEKQLEAAIHLGPVSVAIEADKPVFQHYKSGVMSSSECGTKLDHGVLAVGFGSEGTKDYFIVKNSWGPSWGERGYVRLGRGGGSSKGTCGIAMQPVYPRAAAGPAPSPSPPPPSPSKNRCREELATKCKAAHGEKQCKSCVRAEVPKLHEQGIKCSKDDEKAAEKACEKHNLSVEPTQS